MACQNNPWLAGCRQNGTGLFTRCPLGCKPEACVASTSGGLSCLACMQDLVVNTTDGLCSCPTGRYSTGDYKCADCPKGAVCKCFRAALGSRELAYMAHSTSLC